MKLAKSIPGKFLVLALAAAIVAAAAASVADAKEKSETSKKAEKGERSEKMLTVTSSAFGSGEKIPKKYSGEGEDISPPLSWSGAPEGTKEFAIICDDPDAPMAEPFVHWVAYNISADRTSFEEGKSQGATDGKNDFGKTGYGGPMPPPGHGVHHYHFKVYALDTNLGLEPGITKKELLDAMEGHILAEGELVGTYER